MKDKRLTILSEIEEFAFYGIPDFDEEQRAAYFTFTQEEINLICRCREFHAQVYCAIQIGYFKAKNMFFKFSLSKLLFLNSIHLTLWGRLRLGAENHVKDESSPSIVSVPSSC